MSVGNTNAAKIGRKGPPSRGGSTKTSRTTTVTKSAPAKGGQSTGKGSPKKK